MNELVKYDEKVFTPTGLNLPPNMTFDDWLSLAPKLRIIRDASLWWWGDYINYGEHNYHNKYTQALEESDYSYSTLSGATWVCKRIEPCRRRQSISYSFHQEIAATEEELLNFLQFKT